MPEHIRTYGLVLTKFWDKALKNFLFLTTVLIKFCNKICLSWVFSNTFLRPWAWFRFVTSKWTTLYDCQVQGGGSGCARCAAAHLLFLLFLLIMARFWPKKLDSQTKLHTQISVVSVDPEVSLGFPDNSALLLKCQFLA